MGRQYHVAVTGRDSEKGTKEKPFRSIQKAAEVAMPGDVVIVHEGVYREWVDPKNAGLSDSLRITYMAAENEKVVLKGSERIQDWENVEGFVWKVTLPNDYFGSYNPYMETLYGDWFAGPGNYILHPGEVYLNGQSLFEASSLEEVKMPQKRESGYANEWIQKMEKIPNPEDTLYQWYTENDGGNITIYANFQGKNPNEEMVEINVREACFYPTAAHCNYITLKGFEFAQAATPFVPPTSNQIGMVGAHWSKGWIIEDCEFHDAKCSALSIGTDAATGNNQFTKTRRKPGYTYQNEAVCRAIQLGWSKESVGSHIIRNNVFHDCGQNAIVGHLGCVFSSIYGNEIYRIATKHEFFGYEIGGIKLHAAIDVQICKNYIHDCSLGLWLDWEAQGTRVSGNLFDKNDRDMMIEVTHGPYIVDNNILTSECSLENTAQGGAYIHNLFCGGTKRSKVLDRSTPYHFAHTTQVMGTSFVYSGDDKLYQNIFVGNETSGIERFMCGTAHYNGCPTSMEEYTENIVNSIKGDEDENLYVMNEQPVFINGNCYLNKAEAFDKEQTNYCCECSPEINIYEEQGNIWMDIKMEKEALELSTKIVSSQELGLSKASDCEYETPEGTPIVFDIDYAGEKRECNPVPGPIQGLKPGMNKILLWKRD